MPKLEFDGAPRVFDQMTSDQAQVGPLNSLYHHLCRWEDLFYLTRPMGNPWPSEIELPLRSQCILPLLRQGQKRLL